MASNLRVASPPAKAVMIYDGDCNFCSPWVRRWQHATGDRLDCLPFQDASVAARFPEVPRDQFENAVQLVEPSGAVYGGAEAVFRALALNPHEIWLLDWYEHSPVFARTTEWGYGFVARHRTFFSALTRLAWGRHVAPPTHELVRWLFLKTLGVIFLIAFVSLWTQISGLVGSNGIEPAATAMQALGQAADMQHLGLSRYHLVPTLCWFNSSDGFLKFQCAAGTALAVLLIAGITPAPCLFLLWLIYLSLATVCRQFLSFQWDNLLLETGFLAIFLAPLRLGPRWSKAAPPSRLVLWLMRWLLFKLMFQSGCVKLLSGDPTWRNLTALSYHFETQPLPTWIAWYAHQLPGWILQGFTVALFAIELVVPFLVFAPRRLRQVACGAFLVLQLVIFLTGNYCFFNLLAMLLCLVLLDDAALRAVLPARLRQSSSTGGTSPTPARIPVHDGAREDARPPAVGASLRPRRGRWPIQITVPVAVVAISTALLQFSGMFRIPLPWPRQVLKMYVWLEPFRTFSSYGLFAVMTTSRPEIVIEGSKDGVTWLPYEFKYKPGNVKHRPRFVEPHQPRLDWQMWFAALSDYRHNPWIISFCVRLMRGSRPTLALLEHNPFPNAPPRYIRAVLYEYRFTNFSTRRKTGAWWSRQQRGIYLPPFSLSPLQERPAGQTTPPAPSRSVSAAPKRLAAAP